MPRLPSIQLPTEVLPADGRFGSGPSKVRSEAVRELGVIGSSYLGTSHRRPAVKSMVAAIREGLTAYYELPPDFEVILGIGGATAFWDAASFGLIEQRSQHLVFGVFSRKFADVVAAAPHLEPPVIVESDPGTHPVVHPNPEVDAYALTHNETTTGVAMPVTRPKGVEGLVVVDGTSAAGAIEVSPSAFDAYYFSPQKAFGSEGGLWIALCSPLAISRIERLASQRWIPPFLDLRTALDNSRKDQTYNTPALATLFLMRRQLDWMLDMGGMAWASARSRHTSGILYDWAEASDYATPFVADPQQRSPTVVTIDLIDTVDADIVAGVLRANDIVDTESYRTLGRNQLRVAAFPNIEPSDAEKLTRAIDYIAERL